MNATETPPLACPRCRAALPAGAFYGPGSCPPCRTELRATADHRYAGWLAVHFLAGQLTDPKPAGAAQDRPGGPADPSPRAPDPEPVSRPHSAPGGEA